MKTIFLFFLSIVLNQVVNAQWKEVYPASTIKHHHHSIKHDDTGRFFLLGAGTLTQSETNGDSWQYIPEFHVPQINTPSYSDVVFAGGDTVYFSWVNKLYRSTDLGKSWNLQLELSTHIPSIKSGKNILDIYFRSSKEGFAVGTMDKILKTEDGGKSWDTLSLSYAPKPYRSYHDIEFANDSVGFIGVVEKIQEIISFGNSHFLKITGDGGHSWEEFEIEPAKEDSFGAIKMDVIDQSELFILMDATTFHQIIFTTISNNSPEFEKVPLPEEVKIIEAMDWINTETGLIYAKDTNTGIYHLYRTTDRGSHWKKIPLTTEKKEHTSKIVEAIAFNNTGTGVITGIGGLIMVSYDSGASWIMKNKPSIAFNDIQFINNSQGFAIWDNSIFKTDNGAKSWTKIEALDSLYAYKLDMENEQNGVLSGYRNYNYLIKNGEVKQMQLPVMFFLNSYFKKINQTIYGTGLATTPYFHPVLIYSQDEGETWEVSNIAGNGYTTVSGLYVSEDSNIYVHTTGVLYHYNKQTNLWDSLGVQENGKTCIYYGHVTEDTIVGALSGGGAVYSYNGGLDWEKSDLPDELQVRGFVCVSEHITYVFGYEVTSGNFIKDAVWRSEDGGAGWTKEELGNDIYSTVLCMSWAGDTIYANTESGRIFKAAIPDPVISSFHEKEENNIDLFSVYPVPATEQIILHLPDKSEMESARTINSLGISQAVKTEYKNSGESLLKIDTYPPGWYVLEVVAKDGEIFRKKFLKE